MQFSISEESRNFIEKVYAKVQAENKAILGRAGLFLALNEGVPDSFSPESDGVTMRDDTILGDELPLLVRAAMNHRAGKTLTDEEYRKYFKRYFDFGCHRLKQIWEDSGEDWIRFISLLSEFDVDNARFAEEVGDFNIPITDGPVKLQILHTAESWLMNASGGNGLMVVSGKPGRGKTQLVLDLLVQLSRQGVRFLFFDMKGELGINNTSQEQMTERNAFFQKTQANYTQLITDSIPINPFLRGVTEPENAQIATEVASLVKCFASQLGAIQENDIRDAYQELSSPDFPSLVEQLQQRSTKGVSQSILKKINDFKLFADSSTAQPVTQWLNQSQVIDFKRLGSDNETKSLAVAFILNTIMRELKQLPVKNNIQPLKMVLFIDEAHLLLPKEGKSGLLATLARQGRSSGFPIWLASQDADAFLVKGKNAQADFSELADCGVHFSPETLDESQQKKILGKTVHKTFSEGEALLRLRNVEPRIGMVRQFWRDIGSA